MLKPFLAIAVCAALFAAGLAFAAQQKDTYKVTANLKARFEVPKPQGVKVGATGLFTGRAVELANDRARLTWRLTFSKLTGRAIAAHIHSGKVGKAGPVMVALCGPCSNGQRGTATISHRQLRAIELGRTYVNVHTVKNAGGEIRGQVKASETAGGDDGGTSSQPTETTTTTTPYP
jgi:CHRD domain